MILGSVDQVLDLPSRALPSALPPLLAQVELEQTLPLAWPRLAISRPQGSALPAVIVKLPRHPGQQDAQPASVLSAAVVRKDSERRCRPPGPCVRNACSESDHRFADHA